MPIRPEEVAEKKRTEIPKVVFDAFDKLIAENYVNRVARVLQRDVVALVEEQVAHCKTEWLNVESVYEDLGWTVKYDKPAFNESYPAAFEFSHPPRPAPQPPAGGERP